MVDLTNLLVLSLLAGVHERCNALELRVLTSWVFKLQDGGLLVPLTLLLGLYVEYVLLQKRLVLLGALLVFFLLYTLWSSSNFEGDYGIRIMHFKEVTGDLLLSDWDITVAVGGDWCVEVGSIGVV